MYLCELLQILSKAVSGWFTETKELYINTKAKN